MPDRRLQSRTGIVAGGSRGIGRAGRFDGVSAIDAFGDPVEATLALPGGRVG